MSQLPNLRYYTPATRLDGAPVIDVDRCVDDGSIPYHQHLDRVHTEGTTTTAK